MLIEISFWGLVGLGLIIIAIIGYDKLNKRRLINKYDPKENKTRRSGDGKVAGTDFNIAEQNISDGSEQFESTSDKFDGTTSNFSTEKPRTDGKDEQIVRNPFKSRVK